jgi:NADH-quinone oxidoreductase subunit E
MMNEETKNRLSASIRARIDEWILRYPPEQKRSGVFEALRLVQEENGGFLTIELMDAVADYLQMAPTSVYEVVSFYSLYFTKPVGKHHIDMCTNISCALNHAEEVLAYFKQKLGIELNQVTADGMFSLREVECLGACINAPVCQIGKKYYEQLTPEKIDALLAEYQAHGK